MRAVVQRVTKATVEVNGEIVGSINRGLLVFAGIGKDDDEKDIEYMADKVINLRIFEDRERKMNLSVRQIDGEILCISQFTLFGDCRKGRRPNFTGAAPPEQAEHLYNCFCRLLEESGVGISTGKFQAMMRINAENDGPVTILLDSKKTF